MTQVAVLKLASTKEQMMGFFPLFMQTTGGQSHFWQGSGWAGPVGLCHLALSLLRPRPPEQLPRGHSRRAGIQVGTQPSLQSLYPGSGDAPEEKLPFKFLLDVVQLLIRRKWQNKHSFAPNLEKYPSPTKLLANKPNNNIPFWLRGTHSWHDRAIYLNIYMICKSVQDHKQRI